MNRQELIESLKVDIALLEFELEIQKERLGRLYEAPED